MKWKNRGHEFDNLYKNIDKKQKFYLFGAGHDGKMVCDIIKEKFYGDVEIAGFIDNDLSKQGKEYQGLKVFSLTEIDFSKGESAIIISIAASYQMEIEKQLNSFGLLKDRDYFHYYKFISVYAIYKYNKVYFPTISILPTNVCNLNCDACINFTPYIKEFKHRDIETLKRDVDEFFKYVDYVFVFHISGGEPFLYPHIKELLEYIYDNYNEKIYSLETVTNGSIILGKEELKVINDRKILLTIDDYRESIQDYKMNFEEVIKVVKDNLDRDRYVIRKYSEWIKLYSPDTDEVYSEEDLTVKYDLCHVPWQDYRNNKLFSCNYSSYALSAGIIEQSNSGEAININEFKNKKELVEFRLGYTEFGYTEFCKTCTGYYEINPNKVKPAIQKER